MEMDFSRLGKPTDNAFNEAFNGRFGQECLNENWFLSLADTEEKVESWRRHYNGEMPHSALVEMADRPAILALCLVQNMGQGQRLLQHQRKWYKL